MARPPVGQPDDGVILVLTELSPAHRRQLAALHVPVVIVDPVGQPDPPIPSVGAANWAGALTATGPAPRRRRPDQPHVHRGSQVTRRDDDLERLVADGLSVLSPDGDGMRSPSGSGLAEDGARVAVWRDARRAPAERVEDLLRRMTLAEKAAGCAARGSAARPAAATVAAEAAREAAGVAEAAGQAGWRRCMRSWPGDMADWAELIRHGLGQLTRPFGTVPVTARDGAEALARTQREIAAASRFGIPAIAHDGCLAGFTAWTAAIFPIPLAWGASFDPQLVRQMAVQIGTSMRAVGVHQGLAPVLDVTMDPRWGRTEETIGEDPYLVATLGTAYIRRGWRSTGLICTLKHFVGYSASRGGRNLAPAAVTGGQIADLLLPPFEMAIRLGGARSVMHAYTDIDGIPTASDPYLLSDVLRDTWDFTGTVVADYFGISFPWNCCTAWRPIRPSRPGWRWPPTSTSATHHAGMLDAAGRRRVERGGRRGARRPGRARVLLRKSDSGMLDPPWDPGPGRRGRG